MTDLTTLKEILRDQVTIFGNGEIELTYHGLLKLIESSERRVKETQCEPKLPEQTFTKDEMIEFGAHVLANVDNEERWLNWEGILDEWETEYYYKFINK